MAPGGFEEEHRKYLALRLLKGVRVLALARGIGATVRDPALNLKVIHLVRDPAL